MKPIQCWFSVAVLVAVLALGGCAGEAGHFAPPPDNDPITGHYVLSQQSDSLSGAREAATVAGSVSFVITSSGPRVWSGKVKDGAGHSFTPAFGPWVRTGDTYYVSNSASQKASFAFSGTDLYSTTRLDGETVFLWWAKQ